MCSVFQILEKRESDEERSKNFLIKKTKSKSVSKNAIFRQAGWPYCSVFQL